MNYNYVMPVYTRWDEFRDGRNVSYEQKGIVALVERPLIGEIITLEEKEHRIVSIHHTLKGLELHLDGKVVEETD
jgi:hypothetical protein